MRHGYTTTIGPWIKRRGVWRKRSTSEPAKPAEQQKLNAQANKIDAQREGLDVPTDDTRDLSRGNPKGGDRGRSAGRYEERRERVIDNGDDYIPVSCHRLFYGILWEQQEEIRQTLSFRNMLTSSLQPYRPDYASNGKYAPGNPSARYPPTPQLNLPPGDTSYPLNEQMIPTPAIAAAYQAPDYRAAPPVEDFYRDYGRSYYDEIERDGRRGRARSAYSPSRSRSRSRPRNRSSDYQKKSRHSRAEEDKVREHKSAHLSASIAGAVAGGYIGQKAGKGDLMATLAGAVVGAIGANVAERGLERHQSKKEKEDRDWERKYGREDKASRF